MTKDTNFSESPNTIPNSVKKIPAIILDGKAYSLLISNRAISFRKKLAERLDQVFTPRSGFKTWKSRFLYPQENIPGKHIEEYTTAMGETLVWTLQEQVDYLSSQIRETEDIIKESMKIINDYKNGKA